MGGAAWKWHIQQVVGSAPGDDIPVHRLCRGDSFGEECVLIEMQKIHHDSSTPHGFAIISNLSRSLTTSPDRLDAPSGSRHRDPQPPPTWAFNLTAAEVRQRNIMEGDICRSATRCLSPGELMILHAAPLQETLCYVMTRRRFLEVMSHADPTPSPSSSFTTPRASVWTPRSPADMSRPPIPPVAQNPS